ncbi:ankyrin repeat domain-containing protein [Ampullimonas aquatilis]|uniref:ankyrin repeat domain-containing protein n=1 Tax=Ampullimonas aquatilis TaxID=1341549 RepID=UPI003C756B5C
MTTIKPTSFTDVNESFKIESFNPAVVVKPFNMARRVLLKVGMAAGLSACLIGLPAYAASSFAQFFSAVEFNDAATVDKLLARGFDPNTLNDKGNPGLYLAIRAESAAVVTRLLKDPNTDINLKNVIGETPLMMACLKGDLPLVQAMIKAGAQINKPGWTPLHYATANGQSEVVRYLLKHEADPNALSPNNTTPLMMATLYGFRTTVQELIEGGADVGLVNSDGVTALYLAEQKEQDKIAEDLKKGLTKQAGRVKSH